MEKAKVKVACRHTNGLTIRLFRKGYDDGTGSGYQPIVADGAPVKLNGPSPLHAGAGATARPDLEPGITEVDRGFMELWLNQNRLNPFVTRGMVYVLGPVEEPGEQQPAQKPEEPPADDPPPEHEPAANQPPSPAASPPAGVSKPTEDLLPKNNLQGAPEDPENPL